MAIIENLEKSKLIAHDVRRSNRNEKMAPLDIESTIPSKSAEAEAKRQELRDANALVQEHIDSSETISDIENAIKEL